MSTLRRKFNQPHQQIPFFRINHRISAKEMRVIDHEGKLIGVLSKEEALQKAHETQMDLVEIAPRAVPPVAKIIDFNRFLYQLNKKKRKSSKAGRSGETKEMWLTPFIAEHDLAARVARGKELLKESGKLKAVIRFRRRQLSRREFGFKVMEKFIQELGEVSIEKAPHFEGMSLVATITKK
ncbi:translation initiation factor IF-3 [Candidatus Roizmanbacteria bacterium]|nr:translation initiation factor IF-3 [Candidatus Roizmanbacteria bacterium]